MCSGTTKMRPHLTTLACLCTALAFAAAAPLPGANQELDVLQIPLSNEKELDVLTLGSRDQEQLIAERNKRTIGLLRELFPDITKQIDGIVNRIIAQVIRVAGPDVLRSVLGSNRNTTPRPNLAADFDDDDDDDDDNDADANSGANKLDNDNKSSATTSSDGNNRVKIELPTFAPEATQADATNKQIDEQANMIFSKILRALGPTILRTAVQGNTANRARASFDANFDDDDEDDDNSSSRVSVELPTFEPEDDDDNEVGNDEKTPATTTESQNNGATDTQIDLSAINKQLEETIRVARQVKEAEAAAQAVAALQQPAQVPIPPSKVEETIQLSFNNELTNTDKPKFISNELQLSDSKSPAIDELSLDSNEDTADLDDRSKRFLQFGGGGAAGGSSSGSSAGGTGSAGGSGNFLFDIVRLFSGSVQTQSGDEAANSVNSSSDNDTDSESNRATDGYTEGIPGPVTRLVVLANRGLANLVQDLILRVAATSEKFVNFKAKLITALI